MKLSVENVKDIDRYFTGCYVKYPSLYGDKPFYVERVRGDKIHGTHFEDGEVQPYFFKLYAEGEVEENGYPVAEFLLPKKSYFMHEGSAYQLCRVPARQYKRGICNENTRVYQLTAKGDFMSLSSIGWELLNSYIQKQEFSRFDLTGEQGSYALSPRIAVCARGNVFVDQTAIGTYDFKRKEVILKNTMFLNNILPIAKSQDIRVITRTPNRVEHK